MDINEAIGDRVKRVRERLKRERGEFTHDYMADKLADLSLPMTADNYGHYERGRNVWTAEMLIAVSQILEVPPSYFLNLEDSDDPFLGEFMASLTGALPTLSNEGRRYLHQTLLFLQGRGN